MGVRGLLSFISNQLKDDVPMPYLERIRIHRRNPTPYHFAVDMGNFKASLLKDFIPFRSSGFSAADMMFQLRQLFSKFKECNVFFHFYIETITNEDFLRKTSNLDQTYTDKQCSSLTPVNAKVRDPRPEIFTWMILSAALDVNDPNSSHQNSIRIVEGEGDPFLANAVQRGSLDAVLSEDTFVFLMAASWLYCVERGRML
ncbi:hypothetical protein GEMRC1_005952 [Eukaryota sp. GEM-RC1]